MRTTFLVPACAVLTVSTLAFAAQDVTQQRPAPATPGTTTAPLQFEVASVKPNRSGGGAVRIGIQPGGRFQANNVTLRELIRIAYQVQPFQITGGPSWLGSDRFDIQAKAEADFPPGPAPAPGGPPGPVQQMVQGLLADRFKLVLHNETREMPIYELVPARQDGGLGERLKPSTLDCAAALGTRGRGAPPPANASGTPGCGMRVGPGSLSGNGVTLAFLANSLSQVVQRVVTDKTGLTGVYEFEVSFTPDQQIQGPPPPAGAPSLPPVDPNAPSIYTALQEQLGLKLNAARGPVSVLVIDRLEPPTPD